MRIVSVTLITALLVVVSCHSATGPHHQAKAALLMTLRLFLHKDSKSQTLVVGKCSSSTSPETAWHEFVIELINRCLSRAVPMVVVATIPECYWYGDFCTAHGIPYRKAAYHPSRLSSPRIAYFIVPAGHDQLNLLASDLVAGSVGEANGTLYFCRLSAAASVDSIDAKSWAGAVALRGAPLDDHMWEWQGCVECLEEVESVARGLASGVGAEIVTARSSDEATHLLGWDRS